MAQIIPTCGRRKHHTAICSPVSRGLKQRGLALSWRRRRVGLGPDRGRERSCRAAFSGLLCSGTVCLHNVRVRSLTTGAQNCLEEYRHERMQVSLKKPGKAVVALAPAELLSVRGRGLPVVTYEAVFQGRNDRDIKLPQGPCWASGLFSPSQRLPASPAGALALLLPKCPRTPGPAPLLCTSQGAGEA